MNPILPLEHFVPDGEPRVMPDGRLHLYGSYDISGDHFYCSREYHSFSTGDMRHWEHHGRSFTVADSHLSPDLRLYAPDCVHKDGRYILCYCGQENTEGIAVSDSPTGPFGDAHPVAGADGDAIDPAILIDDDGAAYYYWGQFHLRGARLAPDMRSIDESTLVRSVLNESEHGFHEGASIRKRGDVYYLVYTYLPRGRATCLAYATSPTPLGPFVKRGVIIDNDGCDPQTWNNHGGIAEFNGQWYVFYHRSSQNSRFNRRACVEPISFSADGSIDEVEMTTQGAWGPLDPTRPMLACRACLVHGAVHVGATPRSDLCPEHREYLEDVGDGDWAAFKYFDFPEGVTGFRVFAGSATTGGTIDLRLDGLDGPLVGRCEVAPTGAWSTWREFRCAVDGVPRGVHSLYLCFGGTKSRLMDVESFVFTKGQEGD